MKNDKEKKVGAVLVIGGGIGGIQASLDLADAGFKVYLLDKKPSIGGLMARLDKTFPTNDCSMCIMAPKLVAAGRHQNIELIMNADVLGLDGLPGNMRATIRRRPRHVDPKKCTGCGVCAVHCPVEAMDTYNENMDRAPGVYVDYQQAVPLVYTINRDVCIGCGLCYEYCEAKAVVYDEEPVEEALDVGSVIVAPGVDVFDSSLKSEFGYGRYPNVVSCIEFERILSASGPYRGLVLRPYDGDEPKKIAFIQCVGSRDTSVGNEYCSAACCMYATKEAVIAKEHMHGLDVTMFYMDMRSYGKDFDKYIERAESEYGVKFVRSRVASVEEIGNRDLRITYETEEGDLEYEDFNMVVLSSGLVSPKGIEQLAQALGIELDEYRFCRTQEFTPLSTSRPGVFVSGAFQGPKDIPETVVQCSAAAAHASGILSDARNTLVQKKQYPEPIEVQGVPPRIGVFVCHCGINIGGYLDVPAVVEYAKTLPNVVYAERNLFTCSQDTQEKIKKMIHEHNLTRVVVASCTPRTHEPLFQETCNEAGLNRYLFEMANIRDQCSWVHMHEPEMATEKAKDLVRMAVSKSRALRPLQRLRFPLTKKALVLGGGLAGMSAAVGLAEQGYPVALVEREAELGGNLRRIHSTIQGNIPQELLAELREKVNKSDLIEVFLNSELESADGYIGNYRSNIRGADGEMTEYDHGIAIIATGGKPIIPTEYLYGRDDRVMTQSDLEELIARGDRAVTDADTVVMIQCVGSREKERPYCSRFCCAKAVKNARKILEKNPKATVFILYRDMRTYGLMEKYFRMAREEGVIFVRYDPENKPVVDTGDGDVEVTVFDPIIKKDIHIHADLVALSVGAVPQEDNEKFAKMFKVPLNADGFFLEAHMKLRPVDFATDGVFMAGLCHAPKNISEVIAQAHAAVARACTVLALDEVEAEGTIAQVRRERCAGCGTCELVCAYNAIKVVEEETKAGIVRYAEVTPALCKGCGACAASCRAEAVDVEGFTSEAIFEVVEAL